MSRLGKTLENMKKYAYKEGFSDCLICITEIFKDNKLLADAYEKEILKNKLDRYTDWIPTDKKAGQLLGLSGETMKQRRKNGLYLLGRHYRKGDSKGKGATIWWNRNALLSFEREKNGKSIR